MAHAVGQRANEIAIRLALGAQSLNVLGLVLRHGLALIAAGLGVGLVASLMVTPVIRSFLWGVTITDPLTLAVMVVDAGGGGAGRVLPAGSPRAEGDADRGVARRVAGALVQIHIFSCQPVAGGRRKKVHMDDRRTFLALATALVSCKPDHPLGAGTVGGARGRGAT